MEMEPTEEDIETAMGVLLWLHQNEPEGHHRDDISRVRNTLSEVLDDLGES
jgi:hypothetical protein